jgi:hypothetical protein
MRYLIAAVVFLAAVPAGEATTPKAQCKSRCQVQYEFCLKRSTTDRGKKLCKVERKNCHGTCR